MYCLCLSPAGTLIWVSTSHATDDVWAPGGHVKLIIMGCTCVWQACDPSQTAGSLLDLLFIFFKSSIFPLDGVLFCFHLQLKVFHLPALGMWPSKLFLKNCWCDELIAKWSCTELRLQIDWFHCVSVRVNGCERRLLESWFHQIRLGHSWVF